MEIEQGPVILFEPVDPATPESLGASVLINNSPPVCLTFAGTPPTSSPRHCIPCWVPARWVQTQGRLPPDKLSLRAPTS